MSTSTDSTCFSIFWRPQNQRRAWFQRVSHHALLFCMYRGSRKTLTSALFTSHGRHTFNLEQMMKTMRNYVYLSFAVSRGGRSFPLGEVSVSGSLFMHFPESLTAAVSGRHMHTYGTHTRINSTPRCARLTLGCRQLPFPRVRCFRDPRGGWSSEHRAACYPTLVENFFRQRSSSKQQRCSLPPIFASSRFPRPTTRRKLPSTAAVLFFSRFNPRCAPADACSLGAKPAAVVCYLGELMRVPKWKEKRAVGRRTWSLAGVSFLWCKGFTG